MVVVLCGCSINSAFAQILDDSTKQVYGPHTTEYTQEKYIKYNDPQTFNIDTLLGVRHRFNYVNAADNKVQDLGNIGTAMRSLYPQLPDQIGLTSGFNAFDWYARQPDDSKYYDTKSPYTKLSLVFGGNGRSMVDVAFSRSDSTVFNFGFDFKRITSDKQVGATLSRGDRNVESTAYDVYARWHPGKYQLLLNYIRFNHKQFESGGAIPLESGIPDDLFAEENPEVWLNNALSEDTRSHYHIYQQFALSELLQIYHQFDLTNQKNSFEDPNLGADGDFFQQFLIREDSTVDEVQTDIIRNEAGIKGLYKGVFYNFYLMRRDVQYAPKYLPASGFIAENYLGANLRYRLGSQTLNFEGLLQDGGSYKLKGTFDNKFIRASYTRVQYDPAFMYQNYFGNHGEWQNSFTSPTADVLAGSLDVTPIKALRLRPAVTITNINDHIYFNQQMQPTQASGAAQIFTAEAQVDWHFLKRFHINTQIVSTGITGDAKDIFRIPDWLINSKITYTNLLFNEKLEAQFGLDLQYRSSFFGHDYDPSVQQFFLQDTFEIPDYFLADFFINFRVGRALLFAKLVFLNQGLDRPGYFTAPYYMGQNRVFDWGFTWQFYD